MKQEWSLDRRSVWCADMNMDRETELLECLRKGIGAVFILDIYTFMSRSVLTLRRTAGPIELQM